jgi:hypothetical protein
MYPTLPLLLLIFADGPSTRPAVGRVHDLATLTPFEAERLQGRRLLYRIALDSTEGDHGDFVLFDCAGNGNGADDVLRSVWLYPGQDDDVADEITVEAELRSVRHGAAPGFAGFVEYRLVRAEVRRR